MGKLSTDSVKSGSVQKTLQPGNVVIKIDSVTLRAAKIQGKPDAIDVILKAEGEPLENFEGFYINKEDPSLGRHLGQVGNIRGTEWFMSDGETKSKVKVSRDNEVMKWISSMCRVLGAPGKQWFDDQNNVHETIQDFMEAFNKSGLLTGKWFNTCLCGKEYTNREGYTNYDLFLGKFTQKNVPIELKDTPKSESKLAVFEEQYHIKKKAKTEDSAPWDNGSGKRKGKDTPFDL